MIYKIANTEEEYSQIYKLNYKTFVDEIPQHEENEQQILVDKFDKKNIYIIAKNKENVVAMISLCAERPFSLDQKLDGIDKHIKFKYNNPIEIRLLSVREEYRKSKVFFELIKRTFNYIVQNSYDVIFISGTTRQEKLYRHLGFERFHDNVGTEEASYIPMFLDLRDDNEVSNKLLTYKKINYLPGPVDLSEDVLRRLQKPLYSHRSKQFVNLTQDTLKKLRKILDVEDVTILHGSGTLANEAILAQLAQRKLGKGLILANGEFGKRIINQAAKHDLIYDTYVVDFGKSYDLDILEKKLSTNEYGYIYLVHHETSVGILNNLDEITKIAKSYNLVIAVDGISAVGAIKYSYKNIDYLACSSGKAFCSVAGLAIVASNCELHSLEKETLYLDLKYANDCLSIPFTQPSLLMESLNVALDKFENDEPYKDIQKKYDYMRAKFEEFNLPIMKLKKSEQSPVILTVEIPKEISALNIGDSLSINNIFIHYNSIYLREKNILQFSFINRNTGFEELDYTINIIKEMIGVN